MREMEKSIITCMYYQITLLIESGFSLYIDIIIVAILCAVLVLILMTTVTICVIFALGTKRKCSQQGMLINILLI